MSLTSPLMKAPLGWFIAALAAAILVAAAAPLEKTLGMNARLVYLHGAWVWTALLSFAIAALCGGLALLTRKEALHQWSRALGRSGLFFWITFLPMSLAVMQANWNGLFLDEPRFRTPLNLAIVALLLQIGLVFFPIAWNSLANLAFGISVFVVMNRVETILHPNSPIFNSQARNIQYFFIALWLLLAIAAWQQARFWLQLSNRRSQPS